MPKLLGKLDYIDEHREDVYDAIHNGVDKSEKPNALVAVRLIDRDGSGFVTSYYVTSKKEKYCYHVYMNDDRSFVCNSIS